MDKFSFQFYLSKFLLNLPLIIMRERICFKNHESEKAQNCSNGFIKITTFITFKFKPLDPNKPCYVPFP